MKYFFIIVMLCCVYGLKAQEPLNSYKYLIVPAQYEFQAEANQYDLNDLTVFLLKKSDFNVFKNGGVLPADLNIGFCNALNLKMSKSGMFGIKLTLDFVNCSGDIVFTAEGVSREKDYRKAYHEAIRKALESLDGYTYKYMPATNANNSLNETFQEVEEVIIAIPDNNNSDHNLTKPSSKNVTHQANDSQYNLTKKDESNFEIYVFNNLVGTMRQIGNGNYIVTIESHNGIGYLQDKNIVVEYEVDGSLKKLVFLPIAKN